MRSVLRATQCDDAYKIKPTEATRLGYNRKKWYATFGDPQSAGCRPNERVDYKFVKNNFTKDFIAKCRYSHGRSFPIPLGSPSDEVTGCDMDTPPVEYSQLGGLTCVQYGLASALFHIGAVTKGGASMHSGVANLVSGDLKIMSVVKLYLFSIGWRPVKIERGFDILSHRSAMPTVVQLHSSSGSCSHSVTVVGDFIFDSNKTHAVHLNATGLDLVCLGSDTFKEVLSGFRLVPSLQVVRHMGLQIRDSKKRKRTE